MPSCRSAGNVSCSALHDPAFIGRPGSQRQRSRPDVADRRDVHGLAFLDSRRITAMLRAQGYAINRKRVRRLMRQMGIAACHAADKGIILCPCAGLVVRGFGPKRLGKILPTSIVKWTP